MDKNFIYRRESGLVEELILENLRVNPQNSVEMWDLTMQTVIHREPNIDLYRHLAIDEVAMREGKIASVRGYSMESEQHVAFFARSLRIAHRKRDRGLSGRAPYMRGCESRRILARNSRRRGSGRENGCTIRLRAKDAGREVVFRQPDWVKHRFDAETWSIAGWN